MHYKYITLGFICSWCKWYMERWFIFRFGKSSSCCQFRWFGIKFQNAAEGGLVHMLTQTVTSGTPATVDFIHGTSE